MHVWFDYNQGCRSVIIPIIISPHKYESSMGLAKMIMNICTIKWYVAIAVSFDYIVKNYTTDVCKNYYYMLVACTRLATTNLIFKI